MEKYAGFCLDMKKYLVKWNTITRKYFHICLRIWQADRCLSLSSGTCLTRRIMFFTDQSLANKGNITPLHSLQWHDDVIKWKHFPRYWPFVRGIHRSPVNSPHKGQWRGALMFSLIYVWINGWINNREAGDLRRHRAHFDVIVMTW